MKKDYHMNTNNNFIFIQINCHINYYILCVSIGYIFKATITKVLSVKVVAVVEDPSFVGKISSLLATEVV